jgi:alpha-galactosidase
LVIENCSSGGHRLEPSMQALCAMGSFSDAHETVEIPLIAANLHRVVLPRQTQIWAVVRAEDSPWRLDYSLAALLLGRAAISGDVAGLAGWQLARVREALAFHAAAAPILRDCRCKRFGETGSSMRHPAGWQAVRMMAADGDRLLSVAHRFGDPTETAAAPPISMPLPPGRWRVTRDFGLPDGTAVADGRMLLPLPEPFSGCAAILESIP